MKRYGVLISCIIFACGIMWSNLATAQTLPPPCPPPIDTSCKDLIVLSKQGVSDSLDCFFCTDKCRVQLGCDDFIIRIQRRVILTTKDFGDPQVTPLCDEAVAIIPNGSIMSVDLIYHIRQIGPCRTCVGTHEGSFRITHPTTGAVIAIGRMNGTNGLETHECAKDFLGTCFTVGDECCAEGHDEGCMEGIIRVPVPGTTTTTICRLKATYASEFPLMGPLVGPPAAPEANPSSSPIGITPCDPNQWGVWTLRIDGIILCACTVVRE